MCTQAAAFATASRCLPYKLHEDIKGSCANSSCKYEDVFLQGVFCGDCLFMRYGENIMEANAKADWVCPPCRGEQRFCSLSCTTGRSCWRHSPSCRADICNCSIHRIRRGWAPTGSMYRQAIAAGEDRLPFAVGTEANAAILANIQSCAGFNSVAHYIILNNVAKPKKEIEPAQAASKTNASGQEPGM